MTFEWQQDARYVELVGRVINSEGRYVNNPKDRGGPTKFGIATNFNREALAKLGVKHVRDLTLDQAREIYYWKYWQAAACDKIADIRLAYIHFDAAVNHGIGGAARLLFKLSKNPRYFAAGGKNQELWCRLFDEYLAHRIRHFTRQSEEEWDEFGRGWMNRCSDILLNSYAISA